MRYRTLSVMVALLDLGLCVGLLIAPKLVFDLLGVHIEASGEFVARRAAMLFLGLSATAYFSRDSEDSIARQAVLVGFGTGMLALALLGTVEFVLGNAGIMIFGPIIIEAMVALGCFSVWRRSRLGL